MLTKTKTYRFIGMLLFMCATRALGQTFVNPLEVFKEKRRFILGLDNRRTHIAGDPTLIYGVFAGVSYGGKIRLKLGVSGLPKPTEKLHNNVFSPYTSQLFFISAGEEYDFFIHKRYRLTLYGQMGVGYNQLRYLQPLNNIEHTDFIVPFELGSYYGYDLFPWMRLKIGGGWRFVLSDQTKDLDGYFIKLGIGFDLRLMRYQYSNVVED